MNSTTLHWFIPAAACMVAWGFSRFFPKLATQHFDAKSAFLFEIIGEVIIAIGILVVIAGKPEWHSKGVTYALLAGMLGGLGVYWYLLAAERGNVSQLVTVTALYPVITVALGVLLLKEPFTVKQIIGVAMAFGAVVLVST